MTAHTDPAADTSSIVPGDLFARHHTIAGLRALADFLEANPAVPVREFGGDYTLFTRRGDDAAAVAMVDRVAALLGAEITDDRPRGGHYLAEKTFGRITYGIVHVPDQRRRESLARDSYFHNIVLDTDQYTGEHGGEDSGLVA
ncbi:hypothetical protein AGRA3207_004801 [Actinomadura graeca]|uniref:Uncharacterized protein n=1 Tax=Actinomadura graeca TaxID=2750812 RepID=A0ABX8R034_9ACTN|nr:hypothetical protein [Actinomadura graeca]QXJ23619.1 hypothetical protein AGRA3207_004801 [Actinomadura graeca]